MIGRRAALRRGLAATIGVAVGGALRSDAWAQPRTPGAAPEIMQPPVPIRRAFVERAFDMRRQAVDAGDQPFGAVMVRENRIVGQAPSRVVVLRDPTAHAEMEAIRDAARRLGTRDLSGCQLYATSRPCRMCETAAYWAGVSRIYVGEGATDAGAPTSGC